MEPYTAEGMARRDAAAETEQEGEEPGVGTGRVTTPELQQEGQPMEVGADTTQLVSDRLCIIWF